MLMGGFVVTVAKDRQRRLGLGRREMGFAGEFSRNGGLRRREAGLRHWVKMGFLFQRTGAALTMVATTAVGVLCKSRSERGEPENQRQHAHA